MSVGSEVVKWGVFGLLWGNLFCKVIMFLSTPHRRIEGVEFYLHTFLISPPDGGELSPSLPGPFTPRKEPRYPFNRRLIGPHSRYGRFAPRDTQRPGRLAFSKCVKPKNVFSEYMARQWTTNFFPEDRGRIHLQNTQTGSN
jgi:hypothetical protein